jgi:hypothetical protein
MREQGRGALGALFPGVWLVDTGKVQQSHVRSFRRHPLISAATAPQPIVLLRPGSPLGDEAVC